MNCNQWSKLIIRYFSGDLSKEETKVLEKHIASCVQCKQRWEWEKATQTSLETFEPVEAPDDFNHAVWQKIEKQGDVLQSKRRFKWLPLMVGASALAVVVFAVIGFQGTPDPEQPMIRVATDPETGHQPTMTLVEEKTEPVRFKSEIASKKVPVEDVLIQRNESQPSDIKGESVVVEKHAKSNTEQISPEQKKQDAQRQETPVMVRRIDRQPQKKSGYKKIKVSPPVEVERSSAAVGGDASQTHASQVLTTKLRHVQIYNNKIHTQRQEKVRLEFDLPSAGRVSASVFSKEGRLVKELLNKQLLVGSSQLEWDGKDHQGQYVASGIYMLILSGDIETRKFKIAVVK